MNPLLQSIRAGILERRTFNRTAFPDNHILAAIEAYDLEGSSRRRAERFVNALAPLWSIYEKQSYVPLFKKFIDMEINLESFAAEHSSHVNHVIQEFLFGYGVLTNSKYVRSEYHLAQGRNDPDGRFGELFFAWMAASLLHDIGYDVEEAPEEEKFRKEKNTFWDFMTHRAPTVDPLMFSNAGPAPRIIEDYILKEIEEILGAPKLTYVQFEKLFRRDIPEIEGWTRYDHGIISAVKYLVELEKLQLDSGRNYVSWAPNRRAALAMALHNFRFKECDLRLSSTDARTFLAYLLIVSDEIQEWERERADVDAELPEDVASGGNAKRATELVGMILKSKHAFVFLNHRLKDPTLRPQFEEYLDERIILQKKHFPIRVLFPELGKELREETVRTSLLGWTRLAVEYERSRNLFVHQYADIEVEPHSISRIRVPFERQERLRRIAAVKSIKNLLVPSQPDPVYEVYVDHRIDGNPYLTIVFPF